MSFKLTAYRFSNLLINKINEEQWRSSFIFVGAVRMTLRIALHIFRKTFALFIDAVLLTIAACKSLLTPDVIIEADRRDSELEGTSCASMKLLSAVVNSLRAYSRSNRPSFVPNR